MRTVESVGATVSNRTYGLQPGLPHAANRVREALFLVNVSQKRSFPDARTDDVSGRLTELGQFNLTFVIEAEICHEAIDRVPEILV